MLLSNFHVELTHMCTVTLGNAYKPNYRLTGQMQTIFPEKKKH